MNKFLDLNPPLAPFEEMLNGKDLNVLVQFLAWVVIVRIIDEKYYTEKINNVITDVFDKLSIEYSAFHKNITSSTITHSDQFLELWSTVVCAAILSTMMSYFNADDDELLKNKLFVLRIENNVRDLLIGIPPKSTRYYHKNVLSVVPIDLKKKIPTIIYDEENNYSPDATLSKTLNISATFGTKVSSNTDDFTTSQTQKTFDTALPNSTITKLMENAMTLRKAGKPANITRPVNNAKSIKKGSVERSKVPITKARVVLQNTERLINNYTAEKNKILWDLCATEETYYQVPIDPPITQLDITFENFGKIKPKPPLGYYKPSPPPNLTPEKVRARNERKRKLKETQHQRIPGSQRFKYRKVPDIPEVINTVNMVTEDLLSQPMF